jgi:DNA gyrase subunit A
MRAVKFVPPEKIIVMLSAGGTKKRSSVTIYQAQVRRGKDVKFFLPKCHETPACVTHTAKGMSIEFLIPIVEVERVTAVVSVTDFKPDLPLILATKDGKIKKSSREFFSSDKHNDSPTIYHKPGDEPAATGIISEKDEAIIVTEKGQYIRFNLKSLHQGELIGGVRLKEGYILISYKVIIPDAYLLIVTADGNGKLTPVADY